MFAVIGDISQKQMRSETDINYLTPRNLKKLKVRTYNGDFVTRVIFNHLVFGSSKTTFESFFVNCSFYNKGYQILNSVVLIIVKLLYVN